MPILINFVQNNHYARDMDLSPTWFQFFSVHNVQMLRENLNLIKKYQVNHYSYFNDFKYPDTCTDLLLSQLI